MRPRSLFLRFFLVMTAAGVAAGAFTAYIVSARLMETLVRMEKRPLVMVSGETFSIASEAFHGLLDYRKEGDPVAVQTAKQDVLARIANYSPSGVRSEYHFAVLDDENRILMNSGPQLDPSSFPSLAGSREIREVSFKDLEGRAVFGYHRYFPAWRWHLLTLVHDEDLQRDAHGILFLLAGSGTIALAAFLSLSYFLLKRHIQEPLVGLVGYARRIMSGRYEAEPVTGTGEIGELSEAFRRMAEAIHEREKSLTDLARFTASNPNLVMKVDREGRILYANTSVERALHEMGLPIQHGEILLPDDAGEIARELLASRGKTREVTCIAEGRTIEYTIFGFEGEEAVVFHGSDVTEKERQKGTGLGMALVGGIVKNHGGYVTVKSTLGAGTSIRMDFPASEETVPAPEPAGKPPMPERRDMQAGTALLVDDEELVRDVAGAMLVSLGYKVLTASNGREGVELFRRERDRISLTLLNLRMPVMDGKKAFEEIRSIDPSARVVISTGFSGDEDVDRMKAMGAAAILSKPYSYGEIARLVAELGERREPVPSAPPVEKE